jgi:hypothetical protein
MMNLTPTHQLISQKESEGLSWGKVAEVEQILERRLCSRFKHATEDTVMGL